MKMELIVIAFLLLINLVAFLMYGIDKRKAIKNKWRISEAALLGVAVLGGSIGAYAGMQVFRHKTKHLKFVIGVPVIFILQVMVAIYVYIQLG